MYELTAEFQIGDKISLNYYNEKKQTHMKPRNTPCWPQGKSRLF